MNGAIRAAHLARLQAAYPAWRVTMNIPGVAPHGFTAVERATGRRLAAPDLAELEAALMDADGSKGGTP